LDIADIQPNSIAAPQQLSSCKTKRQAIFGEFGEKRLPNVNQGRARPVGAKSKTAFDST
jgi:hypothetical protein